MLPLINSWAIHISSYFFVISLIWPMNYLLSGSKGTESTNSYSWWQTGSWQRLINDPAVGPVPPRNRICDSQELTDFSHGLEYVSLISLRPCGKLICQLTVNSFSLILIMTGLNLIFDIWPVFN